MIWIYYLVAFVGTIIADYLYQEHRERLFRLMRIYHISIKRDDNGVYTASTSGIHCNGRSEMKAVKALIKLLEIPNVKNS